MANPTSQLKFNEMIKTIAGFRCSCSYRYNVHASSDQDHMLDMAQLKHIDLSDISENIQGINYERVIMTFPNGGKFVAVFSLEEEIVSGFGFLLGCNLYAEKPNGTRTWLGHYRPNGAGGGWGYYYCPANLAKTYGVYFFLFLQRCSSLCCEYNNRFSLKKKLLPL